MAEIASKYITAGGPYNWAGRSMIGDYPFKLFGTTFNFATFPSYLNATLCALSFFGSMASVNSACAQALFSMNIMYYWGAEPTDVMKMRNMDIYMSSAPYYSHQGEYGTWKTLFGITVAITVVQFLINQLPLKHMNKASWASFWLMVFGCLMLIIGLPAIAPKHQSWKWVWTKWYTSCNGELDSNGEPVDPTCTDPNPMGPIAFTGVEANGGSTGWMFCAGLLMSQFLVNCYDQPSHMAEETHHASWTVPRAIIGSYVCAGFLNLCILLSFLFSIQVPANLGYGITQGLYGVGSLFWDVFAARFPDTNYAEGTMFPIDATCMLKTGIPCINLVTGLPNPTTAGRNGAMFFTFIVACGAFICGLMNTCSGARFLYAWARDNGLPFSRYIRMVVNFNGVPVVAMSVFSVISIAFLCSNLSVNPLEGYLSVSAISANGYLMAYGIPCLLRLTFARNSFEASPDFDLGIFSKPMAALGVAVSAFSVATIALPAYMPANKDNLNYAGVALGAAILIAMLFWPFASAVWGFVGPSSGIGHDSDSLKAGKAGLEPADAPTEKAVVADVGV